MQSYSAHVSAKSEIYSRALLAANCDHAIVSAGSLVYPFRDDLDYPFRCNAYFSEWVPVQDRPESYLLLTPGKKPELFLQAGEDFWDSPPAAIPDEVAREFTVTFYADALGLKNHFDALGPAAWLGFPDLLSAQLADFEMNPVALINHIDYHRAYKTEYEISCLEQATRLARRGHAAAQTAFAEGRSELEIHLAYLAATACADEDLPYRSIIALNENCATLHHMVRQKAVPHSHRSMLIDAGARCHGYASDISRTFVARDRADSLFAELVAGLDQGQRELVAGIRIGMQFADLHEAAHRMVAELLVRYRIIVCSLDEAVSSRVSGVFFPHGLGHLLGIQVHDKGGHLCSPDGTVQAPPAAHPHLRFTRSIEPDMVFTVEPGIYFIDALIAAFPQQSILNVDALQELSGFGGIRIEDNVLAGSDAARNITREIFEGGAA